MTDTEHLRRQFNAGDWFDEDGNNFRHQRFAGEMAAVYPYALDTETGKLYFNDGNRWIHVDDNHLMWEIQPILGTDATGTDVNEAVKRTKGLVREDPDDIFDLPSHMLSVKNGVIDLRDGTLHDDYEYPGTRNYVDVEYDPMEAAPEFHKFLTEVLHEGDVDIMWEVIGYCLYRGYPFQKAFMFLGDGANGKSVLLSAIGELLGDDNVSSVTLQDIVSEQFSRIELDGSLANVAPDLDSGEIDGEGMFKAMTGGDKITADVKHKDMRQFKNTATLLFPANRMPRSPNRTSAFDRRWMYFEFPNKFEGDDRKPPEHFLEKFREEHEGMLAMAVSAFGDLWERGGFEDTVFMERHGKDAHMIARDPASVFIDRYFEYDTDAGVRIKSAYETFESWCEEHGHRCDGRDEFEKRVESMLAPDKGRDETNRNFKAWFGIRLDEPL